MVIGNNGGPASPHCDGWITYAMPDCSKTIYIDSVEMLERNYPLRFRSLRLLPDSGGAGRMRGGPASEVIYGPTATPLRAFYLADFAHNPPLGVLGGLPGMAASASVIDGRRRRAARPSRSATRCWRRGSGSAASRPAAAATATRSTASPRRSSRTCSKAG